MEEKLFLDSPAVKVTNARFVVGNQTYAMSSVNSVKTHKKDVTPSLAFPGWMVAVGAIWLLVHTINSTKDVVGYIWPLALLVFGIRWISKTKTVFEYSLVLTTSSGETTALKSRNGEEVSTVESAITDAIIFRG